MTKFVCLTVDVERDCPPFLHGFRGITHGLPKLFHLIDYHKIKSTFFVTGNVARRFPTAVSRIVEKQHELGCHGETHTDFRRLDMGQAAKEIKESADFLRQFAPATSFRAPYLQLPPQYLPLLLEHGFKIDSSQGRYKPPYRGNKLILDRALTRIPASMTSSMLRLPTAALRFRLNRLENPAVLFVHPWEFVDLSQEKIRIDCRWRTGETALQQLGVAIHHLQKTGWQFVTLNSLQENLIQKKAQ